MLRLSRYIGTISTQFINMYGISCGADPITCLNLKLVKVTYIQITILAGTLWHDERHLILHQNRSLHIDGLHIARKGDGVVSGCIIKVFVKRYICSIVLNGKTSHRWLYIEFDRVSSSFAAICRGGCNSNCVLTIFQKLLICRAAPDLRHRTVSNRFLQSDWLSSIDTCSHCSSALSRSCIKVSIIVRGRIIYKIPVKKICCVLIDILFKIFFRKDLFQHGIDSKTCKSVLILRNCRFKRINLSSAILCSYRISHRTICQVNGLTTCRRYGCIITDCNGRCDTGRLIRKQYCDLVILNRCFLFQSTCFYCKCKQFIAVIFDFLYITDFRISSSFCPGYLVERLRSPILIELCNCLI